MVEGCVVHVVHAVCFVDVRVAAMVNVINTLLALFKD